MKSLYDKFRFRIVFSIIFFMLFSSLLFCSAYPCLAEENDPAPVVRVAMLDYANLVRRGDDDSCGCVAEYLADIQKHTGWKYKFINLSLSESIKALSEGKVDILAGLQYTKERTKLWDYSKESMGEDSSLLCVKLDSKKYAYNDFANFGGMRIAAVKGTLRAKQAAQKLAGYGASAKFIYYNTNSDCKTALENDSVDAIIMSSMRFEYRYKIIARLSTAPVYFCVNKARPDIKKQLDRAMYQIYLDDPYYNAKLYAKYFGDTTTHLALSRKELDFIRRSGVITVAVSPEMPPTEYFDKKLGKFRGAAVDVYNRISEYTGLKFRFVPRKNMDTLVPMLRDGSIQMISSVVNDRDVYVPLGIELTSPFYTTSFVIVANTRVKDYHSSKNTIVTIDGYPIYDKLLLKMGYNKSDHLGSYEACVEAVNKGRYDMTIVPFNSHDRLVRHARFTHLTTYSFSDREYSLCAGVSQKADPLLLSIMNKAIASVSEKRRISIFADNIASIGPEMTPMDFLYAKKFDILCIVLALVLFFLCFIVAFALNRKKMDRELKEQIKKADEASRAKSDFLSRMSHDLRTPMNGILGTAYLVQDSDRVGALREGYSRIIMSGKYMLSLINDTLDISKIEAGKMEIKPEACDEEILFNNIIQIMTPSIKQKHIDFTFTKHNIDWQWMNLDGPRVQQIFTNLLSNAVKFTPAGGKIELLMELVSWEGDLITDHFAVRDNGIGMSRDFLEHLFEPFAQEHRVETEAYGGSGLGLCIVKQLVELMGGTITVKSEIGKGSEFDFTLQFPVVERPKHADIKAEPETDNVDLRGRRILLCEDHPINAEIAEQILEKVGCAADHAEDGQKGVEMFGASVPGFYDLILMDIRMPVMDGLEATRTIRAMTRPDAKNIPIVAMTANAFDDDVTASLDAGMNAHLSKPIDPPLFYKVIAEQISKNERNAAKG